MKRTLNTGNKFSRLFKRSKEDQTVENAVGDLSDSLTVWPWEDDPSANNPLKIATVFRCVRFLSESVAQLPLYHEILGKDGIWIQAKDDLLSYLLRIEPMEGMGALEFWRQAEQQLLCTGNAYILPHRNKYNGDVERLILLSPNACTYNPWNKIYTVNDSVRGIQGEFLPHEIIHLRGISRDGEVGVSVLEFARTSTTIAIEGDKETRSRFKNGGNVRGFLTNTPVAVAGYNPYSDKLLKEIAKKKEDFFRAGGRISYIPGAMQFKELMMNSTDMQFLESRKFTVPEICRFFGVDPIFVFDSTSSNYKSVGVAMDAFLRNTLNPMLVHIEQELLRKLLPFHQRLTHRFRFNRDELYVCEPETRIRITQQRINACIDTPNEARRSYNRHPVEGGDTPLVSANLKTIEEMTEESEQDNGDNTAKED